MVDGDDIGVHDSARALERVHGRVDAALGDGPVEHGRRVKVRESRRWRWICNIICWHVDGLHGGDGPLLGGGNALLEHSQVLGERRLVPDGGRDTAEERGHLGVRLCEAENVVNEEEHVLVLDVTEVLGHGERALRDARTGAGWLVHLAVDEHALGLALEVDDFGCHHFEVEICALARALADTGEHRETAVALGDVVDELHNDDSLSDAGAPEEPDLSSLAVWENEVDDLDSGGEDGVRAALVGELWGDGVDGELLVGLDWAALVDGGSHDVENAAKRLAADWDGDLVARGGHWRLELQKVGRLHGNAAAGVCVNVLDDLERERFLGADVGHGERGEHRWDALGEVHVDDGTDDLGDVSDAALVLGHLGDATVASVGAQCLLNGLLNKAMHLRGRYSKRYQ